MVCTVYTTSPFSSASAHLTPSKGTYSLQIRHIRRIRRTSQLIRHQSLHEKRNAKDIHPRTMQRLDGRRIRPDVIRPQSAGDIPGAEFSTGLVATEPCFLSICVFRKGSRGGRTKYIESPKTASPSDCYSQSRLERAGQLQGRESSSCSVTQYPFLFSGCASYQYVKTDEISHLYPSHHKRSHILPEYYPTTRQPDRQSITLHQKPIGPFPKQERGTGFVTGAQKKPRTNRFVGDLVHALPLC